MNSMNEIGHFGSDSIERIVCKSLTKKLRKRSPSKMAARWCPKKAEVWLVLCYYFDLGCQAVLLAGVVYVELRSRGLVFFGPVEGVAGGLGSLQGRC